MPTLTDTDIINAEFTWFSEVLAVRMQLFLNEPCPYNSPLDFPAPVHTDMDDPFSRFMINHDFHAQDRLLLVLSLVPLLKPQLLDPLLVNNPATGKIYSAFGIVPGTRYGGLLPTLETYCFLVGSASPRYRIAFLRHIHAKQSLFRKNYLTLDTPAQGDPPLSAVISPSPELISWLFHDEEYAPGFSSSFPAKKITTKQTWDDLVLEDKVKEHVEELSAWIEHGHALHNEWGLGNKIMPGHRSLFHGPSGTGKTLTATLLGQQSGMDVYRVDLSMVVSKYIGETEKNLSKIFDIAEHRNWILFFDEADALFGKRTDVKDAHDRFANQEISFLLQRVEDYNGLVILATNLKSNIDEAFARRFQSVISFPMPKAPQREQLWQKMLSGKMKLSPEINITDIAKNYELSGGSIINVVQYCSLMALKRKGDTIILADIQEGIKREFGKAGKAM
jgi:AAA+ superfamily predicted ATPase